MNNFTDIIKGRRSIRRYRDTEIPDQFLHRVLESVQWSPSWANSQCWEVIVVRNQDTRERLGETLSEKNPARKAMSQAPVVLALCAGLIKAGYKKDKASTKFGDWFMFDLGIATQSLCLTAHSLGLGTVIVGAFDHDRAKEILGVHHTYEIVTLLPLGYPAKDSPAPKRREIGEFTHYESF